MAKRPAREDIGVSSTPKSFPETTPPNYPSQDHSFTVQGIFDLKGTVSGLEQQVIGLKSDVAELKTDLRSVQRTLYMATGGAVVIAAIGGFLLSQVWDTLMELAELVRHLPKP